MNSPSIAQNPGALPSDYTGAQVAARASFGKLLLFAVLFFTIVLDFRRVEGDENPFVMIMGVGNVLLGVWFCLAHGNLTARLLCWVSAFFLLAGLGTITGTLYGQEIYLILSHAVPILSFSFAAIAVYSIRAEEKQAAIRIIFATCIIAAAVKFVFGFYYYDLDLDTVRYQIISGSVPLLFAYGFAALFSKGRKFAVISIFLPVVIVAFSVTRTYIIVFSLIALISLYSYSKTVSRLSGALVIVAVVATLGVALSELFPGILGRWTVRITSSQYGFDLTAAYRLAEAEYQLRRLWSDMEGLLFGYGHAAHTGLAGDNVRVIARQLGRRATDFYSFGYGHNFYVGLLYVGGLVAGLPAIVALFYLLSKGMRNARRLSASPMDQFLLIWGVSAFAGYLADGMLAGTFGDRSISFFFGVSAGLVLLGTEPARQLVNRARRQDPVPVSDIPTPKQRRAALSAQASRLPSNAT